MKRLVSALAPAVVLWSMGSSAAAQTLPNLGNARAEYFFGVASAADRMARALESAVASGDSVQLAARFGAEVVWTQSTGAPVRGAGAVAAAFRRARPRLQGFRVELAELDASDRMAFVTGRFRYDVNTASGLLSAVSTPFAAALFREREDDWRIRLLTGGDLPASLVLARRPPDSALVGSAVDFEVELRDGAGVALPRSVIRIDVQSGGGAVSPSNLVTDEQGRAATRFTLGGAAGSQTVRVLSGALPDEPLDVRVTGKVGVPASITLTSDSTSRVTPGMAWPAPIRVLVRDQYGNAVPSVDVAIAASGAGTLQDAAVRTDAEGRAETTLRTADEPGQILVEARSGGAGAELALRTRSGLAARIELPPQGVELVERSNRETGARALDAADRPTDAPPLRFTVRDGAVALVTDDARVVAIATGQTWLVARAGDVVDSLWVTVRSAEGSALRSSERVLRGPPDSLITLDFQFVPPTDSLRFSALTGLVTVDPEIGTIVRAEPVRAIVGLKLTVDAAAQAVAVAFSQPGTTRRPAAGVAGPMPLLRLVVRLGAAGSRGAIRARVTDIGVPAKAPAMPLPADFRVPVLVDGVRRVMLPIPAQVRVPAP